MSEQQQRLVAQLQQQLQILQQQQQQQRALNVQWQERQQLAQQQQQQQPDVTRLLPNGVMSGDSSALPLPLPLPHLVPELSPVAAPPAAAFAAAAANPPSVPPADAQAALHTSPGPPLPAMESHSPFAASMQILHLQRQHAALEQQKQQLHLMHQLAQQQQLGHSGVAPPFGSLGMMAPMGAMPIHTGGAPMVPQAAPHPFPFLPSPMPPVPLHGLPMPLPLPHPLSLPLTLGVPVVSPASPPLPVLRKSKVVGFSCHHCKMSRDKESLVFCTNTERTTGHRKQCKKKFCRSCMLRVYPNEIPLTPSEVSSWLCPSCRHLCTCSHCASFRDDVAAGILKPDAAQTATTPQFVRQQQQQPQQQQGDVTDMKHMQVKHERGNSPPIPCASGRSSTAAAASASTAVSPLHSSLSLRVPYVPPTDRHVSLPVGDGTSPVCVGSFPSSLAGGMPLSFSSATSSVLMSDLGAASPLFRHYRDHSASISQASSAYSSAASSLASTPQISPAMGAFNLRKRNRTNGQGGPPGGAAAAAASAASPLGRLRPATAGPTPSATSPDPPHPATSAAAAAADAHVQHLIAMHQLQQQQQQQQQQQRVADYMSGLHIDAMQQAQHAARHQAHGHALSRIQEQQQQQQQQNTHALARTFPSSDDWSGEEAAPQRQQQQSGITSTPPLPAAPVSVSPRTASHGPAPASRIDGSGMPDPVQSSPADLAAAPRILASGEEGDAQQDEQTADGKGESALQVQGRWAGDGEQGVSGEADEQDSSLSSASSERSGMGGDAVAAAPFSPTTSFLLDRSAAFGSSGLLPHSTSPLLFSFQSPAPANALTPEETLMHSPPFSEQHTQHTSGLSGHAYANSPPPLPRVLSHYKPSSDTPSSASTPHTEETPAAALPTPHVAAAADATAAAGRPDADMSDARSEADGPVGHEEAEAGEEGEMDGSPQQKRSRHSESALGHSHADGHTQSHLPHTSGVDLPAVAVSAPSASSSSPSLFSAPSLPLPAHLATLDGHLSADLHFHHTQLQSLHGPEHHQLRANLTARIQHLSHQQHQLRAAVAADQMARLQFQQHQLHLRAQQQQLELYQKFERQRQELQQRQAQEQLLLMQAATVAAASSASAADVVAAPPVPAVAPPPDVWLTAPPGASSAPPTDAAMSSHEHSHTATHMTED